MNSKDVLDVKFPPYLAPISLNTMSPEDLRALVGGRELYVRGAAFAGQEMAQALRRHGFTVAAFLDQSPRLQGRRLRGVPVRPPAAVLERPDAAGRLFVIMCTGYYEDEFRLELTRAGLAEGRDFISGVELTPLFPAVDISGVCNLRCQGCPRGNMSEHPPAGFMSAAAYSLVLDKLLAELPFTGGIQLYTWGEPLLNKELCAIIAHNRARGVLSIVSTNLNAPADLAAVAAAGPEVVRVSCSGVGRNYETTHTGGRWEVFLKNARELSRLNRELAADLAVELYYHLYAHNGGEDFDYVKSLCEELDFAFRPVLADLYPRENILRLHQGLPISPAARRQVAMLRPDALETLRPHPELREACLAAPCRGRRSFAINWNLRVWDCSSYYRNNLVANFLETPLTEILRILADSDLCKTCAEHGLNCAYNDVLLLDRTVEQMEKRLPKERL